MANEEEHSEDDAPEVGSESEPEEAHQFQFLKLPWIDELGSLSSAIRTFQCRFDELQHHLLSIHNAIDARFKQHVSSNSHQRNHQQTMVSSSNNNNNPETFGDDGKIEVKESTESSSVSELENLCETMCSRGLRKYIISNLSDLAKLREEVPAALKSSPNAAKLVFDCIGRFYLQGSKAYSKDSPMIPARQASILILELFLLSGAAEAEIDPSLKVEADLASIAWRKRLVNESGSCKGSDIDARGLLLFLASFGIPNVFPNNDLRDLLRSSNSKGISNALRRSVALSTRIPDIIKGMTKKNMNVEAVDLVYAFGLEDAFSPQEFLLSFLQECDETWKRKINEARGSTMQLRRANEEKLASLRCVLKCLEDHKLDPVKFLPGWKIHEMIKNLEKDIAELEKRIEDKVSMKRKTDDVCTQKYQSQEIKRSRIAANKGGFPAMSFPVNGLLEQKAAAYLEDNICFSSSTSSMPQKLLDGGRAAHLSNYQISPSLRGPGLVENAVLPTEISIISKAGSFPRGTGRGRDGNGVASIYKIGSTQELAFKDISVGQSFVQQAMPTLTPTHTPPVESYSAIEEFVGRKTNNHFDLYHFADAAVFENDAPKSNSIQTGALPRLQPPHHHPPPYFYN